jgi:hypothetical protein
MKEKYVEREKGKAKYKIKNCGGDCQWMEKTV